MRYSHEQESKVNGLSFSKSGKFLFTAVGEQLNVWNTIESKVDKTFNLEGTVSNVGVNPSGEAVVVSCWSGNLKFYA